MRIKAKKLTAVTAMALALSGVGTLAAQALTVDAKDELGFVANETDKAEKFAAGETGKAETTALSLVELVLTKGAIPVTEIAKAVPATTIKETVKDLELNKLLLEEVTELAKAILGADTKAVANLSAGLN